MGLGIQQLSGGFLGGQIHLPFQEHELYLGVLPVYFRHIVLDDPCTGMGGWVSY